MSRYKYRMVVPTTLVGRVLSLLHGDVFTGEHVGAKALHTKVTERKCRRISSDMYKHVSAVSWQTMAGGAVWFHRALKKGNKWGAIHIDVHRSVKSLAGSVQY